MTKILILPLLVALVLLLSPGNPELAETESTFELPGYFPDSSFVYPAYCERSDLVDSLMFAAIKKLGKNDSPPFPYIPYKLSDKEYALLSEKDRFLHLLYFPENYRQICSLFPLREDVQSKVHERLENHFGETALSARQTRYLENNREEVIGYIRQCLKQHPRINNRMLEIIRVQNLVPCIPELIDCLNRGNYRNTYYLTVLMHLMADNKYAPFLESTAYKSLFNEDHGYGEQPRTHKLENEIKSLAASFHASIQ